MPKRSIYVISLGTLVGFGGLAAILLYFVNDKSLFELVQSDALMLQTFLGIGVGVLAAILAKQLLISPWVYPAAKEYEKLLGNLKLNKFEVILMSLCAGIGEELFFRGFLQNYLGVWLTAILFVAIHGYLNPMNWRISIYGGAMVLVIVSFGHLFDHFGIIPPVLAHTVFDLILLWNISESQIDYEEDEFEN